MSVISYAIRSPDGKQQVVKRELLHALRFLEKSPDGWYAEEFFDGTISRGFPLVAEPHSRPEMRKAITLLELPATSDPVEDKDKTQMLHQLRKNLGELSRAYWVARSI